MARLAGYWKRLNDRLTAQQIAAGLAVFGLVVFVVGVVNKHCTCVGLPNLGETLNDLIGDFYANVSVDCLSVAFAILVIDRLNERRAEQELKAQLIREVGSPDNGIALRAVRELRARGWIEDGSLKGADLSKANLEGANLSKANLEGANLSKANLRYVQLEDANLQRLSVSDDKFIKAYSLRGTIMPAYGCIINSEFAMEMGRDNEKFMNMFHRGLIVVETPLRNDGSRYDGRFNLYGDMIAAVISRIDTHNPEAMGRWYGVSLEEYLAGQEWGRENLARVRRETGLDPDTGKPLPPTNGAEPQSAAAPAQPTPRRNSQHHKASMVAHRARR